jgi:YVTN family beta-propeller protein
VDLSHRPAGWYDDPHEVADLRYWDESTGELIDSIAVESTEAAQLSARDGRVWLAAPFANSLTVIDTASREVVTTIVLPQSSYAVTEMPLLMDGYAWVASTNRAAGQETRLDLVTVIDTATFSVVATIPSGDFPDDIAVGTPWAEGDQVLPGPRRIYSEGTSICVTPTQDNSLKVIDTASHEAVDSIPINGMPLGFTESLVWVPANGGVAAVDLSTHEIVEELTWGMATDGSTTWRPRPTWSGP